MPYSQSRAPAVIDKTKEGSFGAASSFTTVKKATTIQSVVQSQPNTVKSSMSNFSASAGSQSTSILRTIATAIAPAISSKITKVRTI